MAIADPRQGVEQVYLLLQQYFETDSSDIGAVVAGWLQQFELSWVHNAIIEALYQGRYKLVSIEQILRLWQRRGQPLRHYNREFESIIYGQTLLFSNIPASGEISQLEPSFLAEDRPVEAFSQKSGIVPTEPSTPDTLEKVWVNPFDPPTQAVSQSEAENLSDTKLSVGIQPFQPTAQVGIKSIATLDPRASTMSETLGGHPEPIPTFVPEVHPSELHERLQAVARSQHS